MRSSTITLALSLLAAAVSVSGTYTNGNDFFDDLPTCIKDCNADTIAAVKKQCDSASNNLECVCTASDSMNASSSDTACTLGCSDDQDDLIKVSLEMATSCVPYLTGENSNNNSTSSAMSSMTTTATGSSAAASSTGGSMATTTTTTTTSNSTGTATETPSSTASNSPAQAGAAAGRAAWAGSLLVAVLPAALLAGMLV